MIQQFSPIQYNVGQNQLAQLGQSLNQLGEAWQERKFKQDYSTLGTEGGLSQEDFLLKHPDRAKELGNFSALKEKEALSAFTKKLGDVKDVKEALALQKANPLLFNKHGQEMMKTLTKEQVKEERNNHLRAQYFLDTKQLDKYTDFRLAERSAIAASKSLSPEEKAELMEDIDEDLAQAQAYPDEFAEFHRKQEDFLFEPEMLEKLRSAQGKQFSTKEGEALLSGKVTEQNLANQQKQFEVGTQEETYQTKKEYDKANTDRVRKEIEMYEKNYSNEVEKLKVRRAELLVSLQNADTAEEKNTIQREVNETTRELAELASKKLTPTEIKSIDDLSVKQRDLDTQFTQVSDLLDKIDSVDRSTGTFAKAGEFIKAMFGNEDEETLFRTQTTGLINKLTRGQRTPGEGTMTEADMKLLSAAYLSPDANTEPLKKMFGAIKRLTAFNASMNRLETEWKRRIPGRGIYREKKGQEPIIINGHKPLDNESFDQFSRRLENEIYKEAIKLPELDKTKTPDSNGKVLYTASNGKKFMATPDEIKRLEAVRNK